MDYLLIKWIHVLSSTVLFGTGLGSAFYMFFTSRTRNVQAIAVVSRQVVIADWLFTTPTAILQPLTGFYLAYLAGFSLQSSWILWSVVLYIAAGLCWLPVVWIQIRMARIAGAAARDKTPLPDTYWRWLRWWTALGIPAFVAFIWIFYLMVGKSL
jgi:uncharacterized membrane protein